MPSVEASSLSAFLGRDRVVPSRLFASGVDSSNQLEVLVASLVSEMWAERSAANLLIVRSSVVVLGAAFELAVTTTVFLRFTRRPSSSVEVYPDSSESEAAGGGVVGRLRMFFVPRFLKSGWVSEGVSPGSTAVSIISIL